jgi:hypothetical protein
MIKGTPKTLKGGRRMLPTITKIVGSIFLLLVLTACPRMIPDWRHVDVSPLNCITEAEVTNPVLTASDVTDIAGADFVADPFLFRDGDVWYMFFEVGKLGRLSPTKNTYWGRIGVATSPDGLNWTYDRIVLNDIAFAADGEVDGNASVHHSYPQVVKYGSTYYMITEAFRQRQIRFYRAACFPYVWERVYTLWKCGSVGAAEPGDCIDTPRDKIGSVDPTIIRYNGKWWLFASPHDSNGSCYLVSIHKSRF